MDIRLVNIGIIKDSTIQLDGLTVITGHNNSGKTTVGKALYSILDAVSNIQQKSKNDKLVYIEKQLNNVKSVLEIFRFSPLDEDYYDIFGKESALYILFKGDFSREIQSDDLEFFAEKIREELAAFDFETLVNTNFFKFYHGMTSLSVLEEQRQKCLSVLDKLFININRDPELIDYVRENINQTLNLEFSNQIQPVKVPVKRSQIVLSERDAIYFRFDLVDNKIVNDGKPVFTSSPYKRVFLIDDPFIMNELFIRRSFRGKDLDTVESVLNTQRILSHENKLKFVLRSMRKPSVFEETILNSSLKSVKQRIDNVLPGEFEFTPEGEFYVQNGAKLRISNLATGSKMFSLIKILLEKGEIDDNTMLILDEPEAHLHPSWQNYFAEIIVLIVKELHTNIVLTTHSPNFTLAIDAYMRKYNIENQTNFYQTEIIENDLVQYQCVNDDIGQIYSDFLKYLSNMKVLRNTYLEVNGDNHD